MTVKLILCTNTENVIGKGNELLYSIPQDMAYFKEKTMGHTVIMGRKTWESIPAKYRPLPGRNNIILSNTYTVDVEGADVQKDLISLLERYAKSKEVAFVIGGGEIYEKAMPYVQEAHLTLVLDDKEGDVKSPIFTVTDWEMVEQSKTMQHKDLKFMFNVFRRKPKLDIPVV